jgi:Uma2 family endonuclease
MASPAIPTRIGPADHGRRMTLEEFRQAEVEEGYRYELARGILEVAEIPTDSHCQIVSNLRQAMFHYKESYPDVILRAGGAGECRLWLPGMISSRTPDVAVVVRNTPKDVRDRRPPVLVAEVVSKGGETRDYEAKRQEYLVYGIREYWIIDPKARRVTVLSRDGDVWVERVFQGEQTIASYVLPGFAGRVADLWLDAEIEADPDDNP